MFAPALTVLTAAPTAPRPPDLSYEGVLKRFPGLESVHAFGWTGSRAEGWGNALSDVDLYVFSAEQPELPVDDSAETYSRRGAEGLTWTGWNGRYDDVCVDLIVWPPDSIERLLEPYLDGNEPELCGLSEPMQDLVYRTSVAVPLSNEAFFRERQQLIRNSTYGRALARKIKMSAENALNDVAGQLAAGDDLTAVISAGLAAVNAADHCLLLAGQLCRGRKWLLRRMQAAPECGITPQEYLSVVYDRSYPGEPDAARAERVARWAQAQLIRVEDAALTSR